MGKYGEYPTSKPVRPEELAATINHALDIPINNAQDPSGISRSLTKGKPIMELFGKGNHLVMMVSTVIVRMIMLLSGGWVRVCMLRLNESN